MQHKRNTFGAPHPSNVETTASDYLWNIKKTQKHSVPTTLLRSVTFHAYVSGFRKSKNYDQWSRSPQIEWFRLEMDWNCLNHFHLAQYHRLCANYLNLTTQFPVIFSIRNVTRRDTVLDIHLPAAGLETRRPSGLLVHFLTKEAKWEPIRRMPIYENIPHLSGLFENTLPTTRPFNHNCAIVQRR